MAGPPLGEVIASFRQAAEASGLAFTRDVVADGVIHRCGVRDKERGTDGAYKLDATMAAGGFQNHRDGDGWQSWRFNGGVDSVRREYSAKEKAAYAKKKAAERRAHRD